MWDELLLSSCWHSVQMLRTTHSHLLRNQGSLVATAKRNRPQTFQDPGSWGTLQTGLSLHFWRHPAPPQLTAPNWAVRYGLDPKSFEAFLTVPWKHLPSPQCLGVCPKGHTSGKSWNSHEHLLYLLFCLWPSLCTEIKCERYGFISLFALQV